MLPLTVHAQVSVNLERAPTFTIERYSEDWSWLANPARQTGHWTERLKYIPLSNDGFFYLTTGLEARIRYEGYRNVGWGSAPDDSYLWHRLMPYLDFHAGNIRVFVQPILSAITGTSRQRRAADATGVDIQQAFVGMELPVAEGESLNVSVGRKLVSFGSGRFIDRRYGTGVPLPFDGVEAAVTGAEHQVTAFYLRPVDTRLGAFNDLPSRDKAVWGVYSTWWSDAARRGGTDVYYIGLRDRRAIFDQGTGKQVASTFGIRRFADDGVWHWNAEAAWQTGTFAAHRSDAWGVGVEAGYRFRRVRLQPEIAITADIVSGDDDPHDPSVQTMNPLFPNGKYFGALTPIGPRNLKHLQSSLVVHPGGDTAIGLSMASFWRESTADGIYAIPGSVVRSGNISNARHVGEEGELTVAWQATAELNLAASLSALRPGAFIRETGPSRTQTLAAAMATFRF